MMVTWNVRTVWTQVYYDKLAAAGEEEQLAKDSTNKWAAVSNQGING